MIVPGTAYTITIAVPPFKIGTVNISAALVDSADVLKTWNDNSITIQANKVLLPLTSTETMDLPSGPVYCEMLGKDSTGKVLWTRRVPEYVDKWTQQGVLA